MRSRRINENLIYFIIWLIVFSFPALRFRKEIDYDLAKLIIEWIKLTPILLIFFINNSLLIPRYLVSSKYTKYLLSMSLLILIVVLVFAHLVDDLDNLFSSDIVVKQPFHHFNFKENFDNVDQLKVSVPIYFFLERMIDMIVVSYIIVGFNVALKLVFRRKEEEKQIEVERGIYLETELTLLKHQISPHFFMNTLNNIHSLIDYDKDIAKDSIINLAKLMRHILYDSQGKKISLMKELNFIENYVDLMRLRHSDKVDIKFDIPKVFIDRTIPPLIFTSFIENAFKHGISYTMDSYIDISFNIAEEDLELIIKNSNPNNIVNKKHVGIGIENTRKRLDLIYGDNYYLNIEDNNKEYYLCLRIPL